MPDMKPEPEITETAEEVVAHADEQNDQDLSLICGVYDKE